MQMSIRTQIIALCLTLVTIAIILVTWVSVSAITAQVDKELVESGRSILQTYQKRIYSDFVHVERLAYLFSVHASLVDFLQSNNGEELVELLKKESEIEKLALIEIFNYRLERIAVNPWLEKKEEEIAQYLTSAEESILKQALKNQVKAELISSAAGLSIKAAMPVIEPIFAKVLGVVVISFPLNDDWLDQIQGLSPYHVMVAGNKSEDVASTINTPQGLRLHSLPNDLKNLLSADEDRKIENYSIFDLSAMVLVNDIKDLNNNKQGELLLWLPKDLIENTLAQILKNLVYVAVGSLLGCVILGWAVATGITRPIQDLFDQVSEINLELLHAQQIVLNNRVRNELNFLQDVFNNMLLKLLAERDKLNVTLNTFSKFIPHQFLERVVRSGVEVVKPGSMQGGQCTLLYSELQNYNNLRVTLSPDNLLNYLNTYLSKMEDCIEMYRGMIDKFIGYNVMAIFDLKDDQSEVIYAIQSALSMIAKVKEINNQEPTSPIQIGIAIHTGIVNIGTIGSERRMDARLVGSAVNMVSMLSHLTQSYHSNLIITEDAYKKIPLDFTFNVRELDYIQMGYNDPFKIYEVYNADAIFEIEAKRKNADVYAEALLLYRNQKWDDAINLFKKCQEVNVEDPILQIYLLRCEKFLLQPPPENWKGVFHFKSV